MVRIKNRYIVVEIVPENKLVKELYFTETALRKLILNAIEKYYGIHTVGIIEQGFRFKYCNGRTKIAIIRCFHEAHQLVTSILPLITLVGDIRAKFSIIYVGATLMQCNKFIQRYQKKQMDNILNNIVASKDRWEMIKNLMHLELEY